MQSRKKRSTGSFNTVTSCISTTLVLILLGTVVTFVTMANNFSRQLREGLTVELLLSDSTATNELLATQARLRRAPYARAVDYISKERGTKEMNEALQGDVGEFLGGSPIPAEFEVYLHADYANLDSLRHYEASMRAMPGVTDVIYPKEVMQSLDRTIPSIGLVLLGVAGLLAIVSFSLINNTMRLSIARRRHSIQIMKLIGARWGFIRKPFLLNAMGMGLLAGILADGVIFSGIYALMSWDEGVASLISPAIIALTLGSVLLTGIVLTLVCAFFSVNRHLYMSREEANLY